MLREVQIALVHSSASPFPRSDEGEDLKLVLCSRGRKKPGSIAM
ncbi:unnamed protein product [Brassica oleracea var. botrytis]